MRVLLLGISGVLHPSASIYELVHKVSPWSAGHAQYEAVPWLASSLSRWPDVEIVLTSTLPSIQGMPTVLSRLGALATRVVGTTFDALTKNAIRTIRTRDGGTKLLPFSVYDYARMSKSEIVLAYVDWLKPDAWVAVDDEDGGWPASVQHNLCVVDACSGLIAPVQQDRLLTVLSACFGSPVS